MNPVNAAISIEYAYNRRFPNNSAGRFALPVDTFLEMCGIESWSSNYFRELNKRTELTLTDSEGFLVVSGRNA